MSVLVFWSVVVVMTLAAMACVLLPLLRSQRSDQEPTRRDTNIALYRERLGEIEQSAASGEVSAEESAAAKSELEARLLDDVGAVTTPHDPGVVSRSRYPMVLLVAVAVPVIALSVYLRDSDWQLALAGEGPEAVELLLTRLERHLEQQPADVAAWQLLARSRAGLGRHATAAQAYARANALAPSADSLAGEAEALGMAAGGSLQGRPALLLEQALRMNPQHPRGLWYAGLAARQRDDNLAALTLWYRLAQQQLPEDFRELLDQQIRQAGGQPPAAPQIFRIAVRVTLDERLADRVQPDTPVFVYARAPGMKGPPLAVVRRKAMELPLELVLDDTLSMLPDLKLSSVDSWSITARAALGGSAEARSGDLLAETTVTRSKLPDPVLLHIDRVTP